MSNTSGSILIVDDEQDICRIISDALGQDQHQVSTAEDAETALSLMESTSFDLAFVDINLPGMSGFDLLEACNQADRDTAIVIITGRATVANAIQATSHGAYDYLTKPFDLDEVRTMARRVMERQSLHRQLGDLRERAQAEFKPGVEIIGQSRAMQEIYKMIGRVAASPATVLIQGESGTGKEMIARAVHAYSDRWDSPFLAINCSAIPTELLESELFGHERGAFTGATERRTGKFEQAGNGILFLDEICDMPLALQAKLLRVLQEMEFSRVGGHHLLPANCRIIAATNKELEREVKAGNFREDLYFRLKVVVLDMPPLRQRRDDIPLLVDYFIDRINHSHNFKTRGVAPDAMSLLVAHRWPGNVRELENLLIRAAAMAPNRLLTAEDLPLDRTAATSTLDGSASLEKTVAAHVRAHLKSLKGVAEQDLHPRIIALVEKPLLEAVLESVDGNQVKAAQILGINRNTLRKKISDLGIELQKSGG
ncbi:MAG: sigma-54 dependent transcriptional regulator [Deltaproteobacteria bacterium]